MSKFEAIIDEFLTSKRLPYPHSVYIEPVSNLCQLRCPLCPVGAQLLTQDHEIMPMETFRAILGKMPFLDTIELYRSGEPFLNPELPAMIRHAHDLNIAIIISTNFSFSKSDLFFDEIVSSGLDTLVVSLDGASQESYSRYRIGGSYDLVISNIRKLVEAKKRAGSRTPEITWQFLVHRHNEHEISQARDLAGAMGIAFDPRPISLADNEPDVKHGPFSIEERKREWLPLDQAYISDCYKGEYRFPLSQEVCTQLFTRMIVMADGKVLPCCEAWDEESAFGNLLTQSFDDIWYGPQYLDARSRALNRTVIGQAPSVCFRCNNFRTTPSLKDKLRLLLTVCRKSLRHWWLKHSR